MKILITGYKGFIGQNMVNALKDEHDLVLFEWGEDLPDFNGLDWCIHLGAISSTTERNVDKVLTQNYDFSRYLLTKCQEHNVNLQYSSSASLYGQSNVFDEAALPQPQSPYAWSKYLFERYVTNAFEKFTIKIQGFRYFNVYGPHEEHKGDQASPFTKFELQAKEFGVIKIFDNSGLCERDFVHVDKVIDIHKKFFMVDESGLWNIGTGVTRTFEDVAHEVATKCNAKIERIPMPPHIRNQYQFFTKADLTRLNATLAKYNLE